MIGRYYSGVSDTILAGASPEYSGTLPSSQEILRSSPELSLALRYRRSDVPKLATTDTPGPSTPGAFSSSVKGRDIWCIICKTFSGLIEYTPAEELRQAFLRAMIGRYYSGVDAILYGALWSFFGALRSSQELIMSSQEISIALDIVRHH